MMYQSQRWYELFKTIFPFEHSTETAARKTDEAYRYTEARRLYPELPIDEAMTAYLTRPS